MIAAALAAVLAVAAPAPPPLPASPPSFIVTDDTGARLTLRGPAQRIVSLSPGSTELLFAAGAGSKILATADHSDAPAAAKALPRIGDANTVNYERLIALRPDVVIVWEDLNNRVVVENLRKLKQPLYFVRAKRLSDIAVTLRRFGTLAGTSKVAEPAAAALDRKLAGIAKRKPKGEPLRVFYMIWDEPLYTIGARHVISDAIERCGGRNIFADIEFPAPIVEIEAVVKRDPDVMILSGPPITTRDWRERWQRFTSIRAVATGQLPSYDDPRLDRMGPSALDAVETLCVLIDQARQAGAPTTRR
jgi:iron complex transport system substrate-binding protein